MNEPIVDTQVHPSTGFADETAIPELDPIPVAVEETTHPEPELLPTLSGFIEQLVARDDEIQNELAEIRAALESLLKQLPAGVAPTLSSAPQPDYRQVIVRMREAVAGAVPAGAKIAVVSKGDDELLRHEHVAARHFPVGSDGGYAGFHPADGAAAVAQIERVREAGVEFIVFPVSAFWWLDHYAELKRHLHTRYALALRRDDTCIIYNLRGPTGGAAAHPARKTPPAAAQLAVRIRDYLALLLPAKCTVAIVSKGDPELVLPQRFTAVHFPREDNGEWTGYHPGDSEECIAHLEELRAAGVEFIVFPKPAFWWLDHYVGFKIHLDTCGRILARQQQLCVVYALNPVPSPPIFP